jgi:hypothetical protein
MIAFWPICYFSKYFLQTAAQQFSIIAIPAPTSNPSSVGAAVPICWSTSSAQRTSVLDEGRMEINHTGQQHSDKSTLATSRPYNHRFLQ